MDLISFFEQVRLEKEFIVNGTYTFEELLEKSKSNHRIRNVFVYYVLTNEEWYNRFIFLVRKNLFVNQLHCNLLNALMHVESDQLTRIEAKVIAQQLRNKYFKDQNSRLNHAKYDSSVEMSKFLITLVNNYVNNKNKTPEEIAYQKERMKQIDMDNLFHKKNNEDG